MFFNCTSAFHLEALVNVCIWLERNTAQYSFDCLIVCWLFERKQKDIEPNIFYSVVKVVAQTRVVLLLTVQLLESLFFYTLSNPHWLRGFYSVWPTWCNPSIILLSKTQVIHSFNTTISWSSLRQLIVFQSMITFFVTSYFANPLHQFVNSYCHKGMILKACDGRPKHRVKHSNHQLDLMWYRTTG